MNDPDWKLKKTDLIRVAAHFYQKGWMVGTSGNLSVRVSPDTFLITASGRPKGLLSEDDLVVIRGLGRLPENSSERPRPSAEVSIHQAVYACVDDANAVFHIHSVESNIVSEWAVDHSLLLPPLEMIKGFGVIDPSVGYRIDLLENHLDVSRIALDLKDLLSDPVRVSKNHLPAFLIRHHGLTVWGRDVMDAFHKIELLEYVFRFMVTSRTTDPALSSGSN
ncbi:MAG: methylthioribulose 1-phosphate dehydratase [Nitrospiraceae bacterium]|nr:methylthioribulose 1-phosphate dehydratase [Nitrospiraceae bacterium]